MTHTHTRIRAQQRGISPLINPPLGAYRQEQHDGHEPVILCLNKVSVRRIERDMGRPPVARLSEWVDAYKVKTTDGHAITVGDPYRRIWRKP